MTRKDEYCSRDILEKLIGLIQKKFTDLFHTIKQYNVNGFSKLIHNCHLMAKLELKNKTWNINDLVSFIENALLLWNFSSPVLSKSLLEPF